MRKDEMVEDGLNSLLVGKARLLDIWAPGTYIYTYIHDVSNHICSLRIVVGCSFADTVE